MLPKLSLVSYVRDRTGYLTRSLPHWRAAPEVAEIVVVDYGSAEPIDPALFEGDRRCRLIRVENAPYWKQSKAENIAIEAAAGPLILKLDVDSYLPPEAIPPLLTLGPCKFITGSYVWSKSGQAVFWKSDWAAVGGYHEFLSGWGHDDHEFYRRLLAAGLERLQFPDGLLHKFEHDDQLRTAGGVARPRRLVIPDGILRHREFSDARNKIIGYLVPWEEALREVPQRTERGEVGSVIVLEQPGALEAAAVEMASYFAACLFEPDHAKVMVGNLTSFFGTPEEEDAVEALASAGDALS